MADSPVRVKHRVLVVDDDYAIRSLLSIGFERAGIDVLVAETGTQAIGLLALGKCDFCCVILDLQLPRPDGIEIAKYVATACPELPVVIISGHPEMAERVKSEDLRSVVRSIFMKPVD